TQVMGRMLDRLASDEDRESGSYVFPLIVAEYIPHADLFYFSAVTVSLCTEPASAYLRCVHHASAMLPADRLKPGFSDFVEDDLGQGSMHPDRSEEHTSELQSRENLVCRLLLEKKNYNL